MATFFSARSQALFDNILWLPQEGATTGPTGRPPNSYAYLLPGRSILVDAVYSWTIAGIAAVADAGHPPAAFVLTHAHVAALGDGFEAIRSAYGCPFLLHLADAEHPAAKRTGIPFMDPLSSRELKDAGLEVIAMPFHTPGSIMLHTPRHDGVLFAGDSAVGPGPKQPAEPPRLERPEVGTPEEDVLFRQAWEGVAERRFASSVLPLHGTPYVRRADIKVLLEHLGTGPAMNPLAPSVEAGEQLEASGVA
jgi:glyoxylase-like metal-dependent hydrolase (beta-lactamase superfamily II)